MNLSVSHNLPLYGNHWVIVAHSLLGAVSVHASFHLVVINSIPFF